MGDNFIYFRLDGRQMMGVTLLVLAASVPVRAGETGWPAWRGVNRDGKSPDLGLLPAWQEEGPRLLWKVDFPGECYSNVPWVRKELKRCVYRRLP